MIQAGDFSEFPVVDALQWAFECELPIEVTVGLTMSLTGNYSDESIRAFEKGAWWWMVVNGGEWVDDFLVD